MRNYLDQDDPEYQDEEVELREDAEDFIETETEKEVTNES